LKPFSILLWAALLIGLVSACNSTTEPTAEQTLPAWAAPAEIHQPAATIQSPKKAVVGDLGWKSIQGMVQTTRTDDFRVDDAELILRHHSIVHPPGTELTTRADAYGSYSFPEIFLHDSDVLILRVELEDRPPVELRLTGEEAFHRTSIDLSLDSPKRTD
jgi:hypothetical protein